jgi:integrase
VFNLGRREFDIQASNPFEKLAIAREGLDAEKRLPFTQDELDTIAKACREANDDIRWIIAIQLATGSRLGEIIGLRRGDVFLDHEVPHIWIRPHEKLGRSLKTSGSARVVPLLGSSLWGATAAMREDGGSDWVFPRYAKDNEIKATHASGTINKYLKEGLGIPKTSHSFRHSMKDLLRDAGCPDDIQKQILGHGSRSISDSYGQGYKLPILRSWLEKALENLS